MIIDSDFCYASPEFQLLPPGKGSSIDSTEDSYTYYSVPDDANPLSLPLETQVRYGPRESDDPAPLVITIRSVERYFVNEETKPLLGRLRLYIFPVGSEPVMSENEASTRGEVEFSGFYPVKGYHQPELKTPLHIPADPRKNALIRAQLGIAV